MSLTAFKPTNCKELAIQEGDVRMQQAAIFLC
jgi:hypothetical protein